MPGYLQFLNISKSFPGVQALSDVSFSVERGEIVAFVGENGAGKSTLLKILNGDFPPSRGEIFIDGKKVSFANPNEAIAGGVSVIYQERQLADFMTVAENIFMGHLPTVGGFVNYKNLNEKALAIIEEFGIPIKPDTQVRHISVAYQQMVEIMKAYRRKADIYCFDEPTAPLTDSEITVLFAIIRKLRDEGKAVIYVSHRISEIFKLTDRVVIFKDGKLVDIKDIKKTTPAELINLMVGRDLDETFSTLRRNENIGDVILEMRSVYTERLQDIDLTIRSGEIVGLSGLVGAGRTEIARVIFGADPVKSGSMTFKGQPYAPKSPRQAMARGIGLAPEDRKLEGLTLIRSVKENISLAVLDTMTNLGFIDAKREAGFCDNTIGSFGIRTPSQDQKVLYLSGGNQQKVILARWMVMNPDLIILDEPTKGIDVGAKSEIYAMICEAAGQGIAVLLISSEMPEVIGLSDRIYVLKDGRITAELSRAQATEEAILTYAMLDTKKGEVAYG